MIAPVAPSRLEGVQHLARPVSYITGLADEDGAPRQQPRRVGADAPGPEHRAETAPGLDPVRVAGARNEVGVAGQQPLAGG
jgi:hypothetical protein